MVLPPTAAVAPAADEAATAAAAVQAAVTSITPISEKGSSSIVVLEREPIVFVVAIRSTVVIVTNCCMALTRFVMTLLNLRAETVTPPDYVRLQAGLITLISAPSLYLAVLSVRNVTGKIITYICACCFKRHC